MKTILKYIILVAISINFIHAQNNDVEDNKNSLKNGISKPSILSTNPFGILFTRLNHNFRLKPSIKREVNISIESGNIWAPKVTTYIPNNNVLRAELKPIKWFSRQFKYNEPTLDAEQYSVEFDGVLKGIRANITLPINTKSELVIGLRSFLLTGGNSPWSLITNDEFIEYFHDNIAGGSDPFDRRKFELNKGVFNYSDRNGKSLSYSQDDFILGGIETHYYYYPDFINTKNFFTNIGSHVGVNLNKHNTSVDFGVSGAILKKVELNTKSYFNFGLGMNVIKKNLVLLNSQNVELGSRDFLVSSELNNEFNFISKGKTIHSFGLSVYMQTSYNKSKEFDYAIFVKDENAFKSWHNGATHLYDNTSYFTFAYTFTRKIATSFYLQQDFNVNNSPDIQTGIGIKFNI